MFDVKANEMGSYVVTMKKNNEKKTTKKKKRKPSTYWQLHDDAGVDLHFTAALLLRHAHAALTLRE